jgi:hypothetical protein
MSSARPKRFADLPHFLVSGATQGEAGSDGCFSLELSGTFNKLEGVREGRCWLLLPDKRSLIGDLTFLDRNANTALYRTFEKTPADVAGCKFAHLDGYWQAYHVWMVTDPSYAWQELVFVPSDAVTISAEGGDGRRLRGLRKAKPEDLHDPELHIVQNGWDHEHCELCNTHIDPGDCCYCDATNHWVCRRCYHQYVQPHDLSFVEEA